MARKILLADDSVTAQNMGRKILVDAGYDVLTVNNGSAALKRITESKPDLIVLDVYMPGYSGLEVCQRLKEAAETAHIPVLLTVGKLEPFKPEEARRVRADGHIVKPFEASELLSALARLEDRMVPSTDGPKFNASVSGVERFSGDEGSKGEANSDPDTGWKSRLRFPSKKKKEEPEPEPDDSANFREFRKGKGKAATSASFTVKAPAPAGQEPGLVPDIPRDITPEELDVLSALAAKLDGPIPEAENIASLAEKVGPPEEASSIPTKIEEVSATEAKPAETTKEFEVPAPPIEATAAATETNEVHIPVEHVEPASEVAATEPMATPEAPSPVAVNTATLAEEAAPIDRQDEPIFASASAEEKPDAKVEEANAAGETKPVVESAVAKIEEGQQEEIKKEEAKAAETPTVAAHASESVAAEGPAPSDEELAEALRLLTPSIAHGETSMPSQGALAAAGQMLAEEAARTASSSRRWMAQAVALSPEEAAMSLEAEMFRTVSVAPGVEINSIAVVDRVSMITAAVESRLADANLVPAAEASAAGSAAAEKAATEAVAAEKVQVQESDSAAKAVEAVAEEQAPTATFADAVAQQESDAVASAQSGTEESKAPASEAIAEQASQDSTLESGEQDDMGKDGKAKAGTSKWHQIHTPAAGAAGKTDAVEAAKQGEAASEEAPRAMAAAAAAEGSSVSNSAEANAIASIVDSVLADLRPKIVEEIAKKLGKK